MIDPYRMVFLNAIALMLLFFSVIFYKFIFPKKNISYFVLLLLIAMLPILSLLRAGGYESGDFNIHIYRTMEFYNSLTEGNIMPSWAGDLNATYGYPLFIFNYSLPYYLISLFHFLGLTFVTSMKLFLSLSLILSGIFMYLFSKDLFKNKLAAFTSSIFYIFAPYHLIDLHFKVVIGELLSFTLIPLVFFFLNKLYNKPSTLLLLTTSIFFGALIMSHVVVGLFFGLLILIYLLLKTIRDKKSISLFFVLCIFPIAGIISIYTWLTPFFLSKHTFIQLTGLPSVHFPTIIELLYSPWRMGLLFQGPKGEISNLVGYTQILITFIVLVTVLTKKIPKSILFDSKFWLICCVTIFFFITPYSKFIWEFIPFIKATGSHRLLLLLAFSSSVLAGYLSIVFRSKKHFIYLFIALSIGSTILNWGQRRMIHDIDDNFLKSNLWKSTSQGEGHFYANTKWVDIKNPWFLKLPRSPIEILTGKGEIKTIRKTSTNHAYYVLAKTPLTLNENTLFFPGWEVQSNGKNVQIDHTNNGIITFKVPQEKQLVEVIYKDIFVYTLLKIISAFSLIGASIFISLKLLRSYLH